MEPYRGFAPLAALSRLDLEKLVKKTGSWFALVTYCATAVLVAALALAVVFSSATLVFAVAGAFGAEVQAVDTAAARICKV